MTMAQLIARAEAPIERITAAAYTIPTDAPESDGAYTWTTTTIVIVEAAAGGALCSAHCAALGPHRPCPAPPPLLRTRYGLP